MMALGILLKATSSTPQTADFVNWVGNSAVPGSDRV